jgi:hypothetical protein
MRREPLEEGRDGLAEGHCKSYSNAKYDLFDCRPRYGRSQSLTLGLRPTVGSPYLMAERSHPKMSHTRQTLRISTNHPMWFKRLCVTSPVKQTTTNPVLTNSAIDNPMIQSVRVITNQYRWSALDKRINDPDPVDDLAVLHIFGEHLLATGAPGRMDHQRIPIREFVEAVQIDRGQNVTELWLDHVKGCKKFDFAASVDGADPVLSRDGDKVFL